VKVPVFLVLIAGIFVSVSRMAYAGLLIVSGAHWLRNKSKRMLMLIIMIPVLLVMFKLSLLWDLNIMGQARVSESGSHISETENNIISYREYSKNKAMTIWKDHPFWGVGPGMFGAIVSVKTKSYIYELYAFREGRNLLERWNSIDQFWPIVMAEIGIIGTMGYAAIFIILYAVLFLSAKRAVSQESKGLFAGLQVFQLVILIYSIGNIINIPQVIFPFFAFVGMGLGSQNKDRNVL
jgi:hypothetical protein